MIFLLFFISGFYTYYLYKRPPFQKIDFLLKYYPQNLILKTGGLLSHPDHRTQHFLRFPQDKKSAIRIGAFGDSHTYGNEVYGISAYPHQLQKLFDKNYPEQKIEVLNFGMSGHGFQEQFFLWEQYARLYQLDYILIGPRGFHSNKGVSFRKNWPFHKWLSPRERFILSGNKLKLVKIKGDSLKERHKNYYSLIPSWPSLLHDRRPFQVWEKLFPFLRNNISNPFYYKKISESEEALKINKVLLKRIQSYHNKKTLFFTDHAPFFNSYKSEGALYNLNFFDQIKRSYFYKVFYHESSLGNEIISKIYFNALTGRETFSLNTINCHFRPSYKNFVAGQFLKKGAAKKKGTLILSNIKSIYINGGNIHIASLKRNISNHYRNKSYNLHHIDKKTKSFIAFSSKDHFLDSPPYFPVPIQLKEGMNIYILLSKEKLKLGSIKAFDSYKKFFHFYGEYIKNELITYTHYELFFLFKGAFSLLKEKLEKIKSPVELFIENYKLGSLYPQLLKNTKAFKFIPTAGYDRSFLMMGPSHLIRDNDLPEEFFLHIQYNLKDESIKKSPLPNWKCRKEEKHIRLKLPNFKSLAKRLNKY